MLNADFTCECGRQFFTGEKPGKYQCKTCTTVIYYGVDAEQFELKQLQKKTKIQKQSAAYSSIINIAKRFRVESDTGVGDTVERLIATAGGRMLKRFKAKLEKLGVDCGCTSRRDWLNSRYPYR